MHKHLKEKETLRKAIDDGLYEGPPGGIGDNTERHVKDFLKHECEKQIIKADPVCRKDLKDLERKITKH